MEKERLLKSSKIYKYSWLTAVLLTVLCTGAMAATTKVAVIPFQMNAEKDYTFLQKGIVQMLTSRLSSDAVSVVDPMATTKAIESVQGMTGDSLALMAGAKLQADYVIHGSITVLGESVSIDAKMLNITGTREPFHFSKQTASMNEVIPQINLLATDINSKVFNRQPVTVSAAKPSAASPQGQSRPGIYAHPEKLLQNPGTLDGGPTGPNADGQPNPLNPAFETTMVRGARGNEFWKSRNFSFIINGMDVGDVNNDGIVETVLVSPSEIYIYQFSQARMIKVAKIKTPGSYNIGVDVGDINGNDTPEIFVTSLNSQRTILTSQVLEFDGREFKPIAKTLRWYFRIMQHPTRGEILLGQRQRAGADPLSSPIFEMTWQGVEYIPGTRILPGGRANLLGVSYGEIQQDKQDSIVAFTAGEKLKLFDLKGKGVWTSAETLGGSPVNLAMPSEDPGDTGNLFYLPVRTRPVDLDADLKAEILVVQNFDRASRKLSRQRHYNSARIMAMTWDGLGLATAWRTRKISGRVQDLAVADFDNDGKNEILAAVISKEGSVIGTTPRSAIIAYDLNPSEQSTQ